MNDQGDIRVLSIDDPLRPDETALTGTEANFIRHMPRHTRRQTLKTFRAAKTLVERARTGKPIKFHYTHKRKHR